MSKGAADNEEIVGPLVNIHCVCVPERMRGRVPIDSRAFEQRAEPPLNLSHGDSPPAACQKERAGRSFPHEAMELVANTLG